MSVTPLADVRDTLTPQPINAPLAVDAGLELFFGPPGSFFHARAARAACVPGLESSGDVPRLGMGLGMRPAFFGGGPSKAATFGAKVGEKTQWQVMKPSGS